MKTVSFLLSLMAFTAGVLPMHADTAPVRDNGRYTNSQLDYSTSVSTLLALVKEQFTAAPAEPKPTAPLPVAKPDFTLTSASEPRLFKLGHSTVLIELDGQWLLTDPVFSERASPVQWLGPKRFHPVPVALNALPPITAVVISHDHYDHLDRASIEALAESTEYFLVPLGVGEYLRTWGVAAEKIIELDWWQSHAIGSLRLTATPAQHFSGRGLFDKDSTLWASWAIESQQAKVFFSGDSGYFSGFKTIGDRLGPFDITLIETGAYNHLWEAIHMLPEQSVQAHLDLRGKAMIPIHNSTFDLALHDWFEPLERAQAAADARGVQLVTPIMGEAVSICAPAPSLAWWRALAGEPLVAL
ncbi:MBL fold metallo-hydrolase [Simiduia agarivorans]|uniref:Outer membrane protein RomA n=1 Tax=Simiduia agarivorans (strain DSM 21679 / JCM 13881 / BCRC 17597 / SA1) TaxID=1117647 RepID=K4KKG4_SIMAS|nr:MBL fold metallo-hydrolase [Simiduia agarivorans]AFU99506.2 outer membrane protein RomA [Simiduia agarivorans SA1 = DSM 21679]